MRKTRNILAVLAAVAGLASAAGAYEQLKLAMEQALEDRIQFALQKLIDTDQFLVIVKVEPYTAEELKAKAKSGGAKSAVDSSFVLPGIPQRQSIDKLTPQKAESTELVYQSRPFIKRLTVTLFLDKAVTTDLSQQIETLVKQLVDFNTERNDELRVTRMVARRGAGAPRTVDGGASSIQNIKLTIDQIKERKDFYWIVMGAAVTAGLIIFMFGPLMFFLFRFPKILQKAFLPDFGTAAAPAAGGGGGGGAVAAAPVMAAPAAGGKFELGAGAPIMFSMTNTVAGAMEVFLGEPEKQPYNFINEKDIVNILLLMKDEPPLHLAIIAYYLRPDLSAALISGLDAAVRKQVVDHLAAPQMLMRDEVKSLGQTLRTRVRGIIYGVDQYFAIYDSATPAAQGELLKALEAQTPALVEKMRSEMFTFDDLMALESGALRVVFREVALRSLATALTGASAPMRDKVLNVLPSGASEIIRQEIEMNPVHSQKTIEEERKKIVAVVRRLVWDKKITMPPRQRGSRATAAPAAPAAPVKA